MRSVCKTWPGRLVAAVTTLALILASAIGAYAHAAGHAHHTPLHATHLVSGHLHAAHIEADRPHPQGEHERGDADNSHADCLDTICHGGQAILAEVTVMPHPEAGAPAAGPSPSLKRAQSSGPERPPKASVPT